MLEKIIEAFAREANNKVIELVVTAVIFDTLFGVIRAAKEHKFNSCFGIDGAIRKISMIASLCCLVAVDMIVKVNLIGFVPEEARKIIGVETIGTAEFFGLLYICYEVVSILKNMYLCGLPVRAIWAAVRDFLTKYTDELPDADEIEKTPEGDTITDTALAITETEAKKTE
nr:MAG TPA: holin [Caudoviricetes sp.]